MRAVGGVEEGFVEEVVFVPRSAEQNRGAVCGAEHGVDDFRDDGFGDE